MQPRILLASLLVPALLPLASPAQEPLPPFSPPSARMERSGNPAPRATRLVIVPLDDRAASLRTLVSELAALEGFEVLPPELQNSADVRLYLRASESDSPGALSTKSARDAAAAFQRSAAGARADICDSCFSGGTASLYLDLGRSASTPTQQMEAALAVRNALGTLASPGPRTAQKGEIISPAPGSTLPGSAVTFQWTPGEGVQQFWLMIGLWPGGNTLYSADQGLLTSAPVSGLPTDGRTIYVRLWSYIDNQWVYNDYQYKAAGSVTPVKAQITDPAPGSTLPGSTVTFRWNTGAAVARYFLFVGQWQGGNSLFSQDMGTSLEATVTNLPTDGSNVHVRLWSLIDGLWQFNDYTFKAAPSRLSKRPLPRPRPAPRSLPPRSPSSGAPARRSPATSSSSDAGRVATRSSARTWEPASVPR